MSEIEQKNKKISDYQSFVREIEHNNIESNRKSQDLKNKLEDS